MQQQYVSQNATHNTTKKYFYWRNIFRKLTEITGLHVSICVGVDLD